jgi:UDP-N-acetylmuramate dehydrogenase
MKTPNENDELSVNHSGCRHNVHVAKTTWFGCGGNAEILFRAQDQNALVSFLKQLSPTCPVTILGLGSNVLIRDGGIPGVVIKLGKGFNFVRLIDKSTIEVGCATPDSHVTELCINHSIGGLEFLSTIPGTIGGNIRMNAGCYNRSISEVLVQLTAIDRAGNIKEFDASQINFAYRNNPMDKDLIFTKALLRGYPRDSADIQRDIESMKERRNNSQPHKRTSGSTFINPIDIDKKAWELIDQCGLRGLCVGGAQISPKHCNFIINTGTATASDIEALGELVRHQVHSTFNVQLEWEILRMGNFPICMQ